MENIFSEKTVLAVCPDFPYPPNSGSRIDMWGHIMFFHRAGCKIIMVVCMTPEASANSGEPDIVWPIELSVHIIGRGPRWSRVALRKTVEEVQKLVDCHWPQIVWFEYADFGPLASALDLKGARLWFRSHNFELAHALEKEFEHRPWGAWKGLRAPVKAYRWFKGLCRRISNIYYSEKMMHRISDRIFYISYSDMKAMQRLYRGSSRKEWVLPFLERQQVTVKDGKNVLEVIYLGSDYSNSVNLSGARALLNEVIPAIEKNFPGRFHFHLIGKRGKDLLGEYESASIVIHDFIDDLQSFMQDMDIVCLPVKIGWGCKIKMVEALACGLPVIGTPQVFRGVPPTEKAYYICRKTDDYVAAFGMLLDVEERRRTASAGRDAYRKWFAEGERKLLNAL